MSPPDAGRHPGDRGGAQDDQQGDDRVPSYAKGATGWGAEVVLRHMTRHHLPLAEVSVGERHRKDLGDLSGLADSIRDLGVLQPLVCRRNGDGITLVAGQRRLEACRLAGLETVPVLVVESLDDAAKVLRAERDENTCRKPMTAIEMKSLTDELLEIERPKAKERQGTRTDLQPSVPQNGKSPPKSSKEAADLAAKPAGWSRPSYERVKRVQVAAENEALPESVRHVAAEQLTALATGDASPVAADRALKEALDAAGENGVMGKDERPSPRRRSSLPAAAERAGIELRRAVERLERIAADDRFTTNKEQVAAHLHVHLTYAVEVCPGLLDQLNHSSHADAGAS